MKFAFSTIVCPQWSLSDAIARAKEFGFDGVEIALERAEALADAAAVRAQCGAAGIAIAAIATPIFATGEKTDSEKANQLRRFIDLAASLGCGVVKVRDIKAHKKCSIGETSTMLAEFLSSCAEHAAASKVKIVVENAITLRIASRLWTALEQVDKPDAVAACLDIAHAAAAGEGPAVSVPTLASRLGAVDVRIVGDVGSSAVSGSQPSPSGSGDPSLSPFQGEGEQRLKQLLVRLRGIGYRGFVTFESPLSDPAAGLPAVLKKFKDFSTQAAPPKPSAAAAVAAAKAAAAKAGGAAKPAAAAKPETKPESKPSPVAAPVAPVS